METKTMVTRADEQIAELVSIIAGLDQQLQDTQAELAQIHMDREARAVALQQAHEEAKQSGLDEAQASGYARLAQGTQREREAVKSAAQARKAHQTATAVLEKQQAEAAEAEASADEQERTLTDRLQQIQSDLAARRAELDALQLGRAQAVIELGEQRYAAIVAGHEQASARVDDLRRQLAAAQMDVYDYEQSALTELADHPDQRRAFLEMAPPEDSTARVIEATIQYAETMLADAGQVNASIPGVFNFWELFIIPPQQLNSYPGLLKERIGHMRQALQAYRVHQAQG